MSKFGHVIEILLLVLMVGATTADVIRSIKLTKIKKSLDNLIPSDDESTEKSSLEEIPVPEVDMSQVPVKFFVTCICKKKSKANVYKSFITDDFTLGDPSKEDLERVKQKVLAEDPDYVDCTVLFFGKLKG